MRNYACIKLKLGTYMNTYIHTCDQDKCASQEEKLRLQKTEVGDLEKELKATEGQRDLLLELMKVYMHVCGSMRV